MVTIILIRRARALHTPTLLAGLQASLDWDRQGLTGLQGQPWTQICGELSPCGMLPRTPPSALALGISPEAPHLIAVGLEGPSDIG